VAEEQVAEELDAETIAFAHRMFDLARDGRTEELSEHVAAGLVARGADPARVTDRGQTAPAAAVFRHSAPSVSTLLDAGADPAHGHPSALETARFFGLTEMAELPTCHGR
jgi:hypothetical protein